MNDAALKPDTQDIVVDEVFPHTLETIWKTLTSANLMGRWLMMPAGFEPVEGKHFTYQTTPAGALAVAQGLDRPDAAQLAAAGSPSSRTWTWTTHGT